MMTIQNINHGYISDVVIKDYGGDMSKDWYIEFYSDINGEKKRHRIKGMNKIKDLAQRKKFIVEMAKAIKLEGELALRDVYRMNNLSEMPPEVKIIEEPISKVLHEAVVRISAPLEKRTNGAYRTAINNFIAWYGDKSLYAIDKKVLINYRDHLYSQHKKDKTIHNSIESLCRILRECGLPSNLKEGVKTYNKPTGKSTVPWTNGELQRLQDFTKDKPHYRAYWGMIYYCAIRPKEISFLTSKHIDLENGWITIFGDFAKNDKTQNVIIPHQFSDFLREYIPTIPKDHYLFGKNLLPVIRQVNSTRYAEVFRKKILTEIEVDKTAYQLKHTAAVHMIQAKIDKTRIQHHFRHSSVEETETYLKSLEGFAFRDMETNFPNMINL